MSQKALVIATWGKLIKHKQSSYCGLYPSPFQLPRVIIYESVQLVLFVIADTRRSRSYITLTTTSAAMTVLRALVMTWTAFAILAMFVNKRSIFLPKCECFELFFGCLDISLPSSHPTLSFCKSFKSWILTPQSCLNSCKTRRALHVLHFLHLKKLFFLIFSNDGF